MADVRYFNGETRLGIIEEMPVKEYDQLFPGKPAVAWSRGSRVVGLPEGTSRTWDRGTGKWSRAGFLPAQRAVTFKRNASRHACDARCLNATGRTMQCECSCGGKNHGKGSFTCE